MLGASFSLLALLRFVGQDRENFGFGARALRRSFGVGEGFGDIRFCVCIFGKGKDGHRLKMQCESKGRTNGWATILALLLLVMLVGLSSSCGDAPLAINYQDSIPAMCYGAGNVPVVPEDTLFRDFDLRTMKPRYPIRTPNPKPPYIRMKRKDRFIQLTSVLDFDWETRHTIFESAGAYIWADTVREPEDRATSWLKVFMPQPTFLGMMKYIGNTDPPHRWELYDASIVYPNLSYHQYDFYNSKHYPIFQVPPKAAIAREAIHEFEFRADHKLLEHCRMVKGWGDNWYFTHYVPGYMAELPKGSIYWFYVEERATLRPFLGF